MTTEPRATTGDGAHAATTGGRAHAATTGDRAHAATTGDRANAATTGDRANAATTGYRAHAATTGDWAHAATTGDRAHAYSSESWATADNGMAIGTIIRLRAGTHAGVLLPVSDKWLPVVVDAHNDPEFVDQWIAIDDITGTITVIDCLLPDDGRGYQLTFTNGRYQAGCRNFDYAEAVAHWSNPDHEAPYSAGLLLAEVECHHATVTA